MPGTASTGIGGRSQWPQPQAESAFFLLPRFLPQTILRPCYRRMPEAVAAGHSTFSRAGLRHSPVICALR